ncbi:MAG TPA: hypothetical protein VIL81_07785 [Candidatus Limnocylindrales bacterium]
MRSSSGMPRAWDLAAAARRTIVDLAVLRTRLILLALSIATIVALIVVGRHLTFWQDEWAFIGAEPTSIGSWLTPHNEHWSTVPLLLYRAILGVVGLHSYLPYLALLAAMHVIAAGGAFVLLARRLPPWAALLGVVPLLVLGSGYQNLVWAFQIGFVGSVAAGTWGLVALETDQRPRSAVLGVALLIVALASSGMGLFFVLAAAVRLAADPASRRRVLWLAIPAGVFVVWYLTFGRHGQSGPFAEPADVLVFAARGLVYAVARMAGFDLARHASLLGSILAVAALALVSAVLVRDTIRRSLPPLAVAGFVAAIGMYTVVGLTRADRADDFATMSRYVYVAAFLLVPAAADLTSHLRSGRRLPTVAVVGLLALVCLSVGANLVDLRAGRRQFSADARLTRAYLTVLAEHRGASWLDAGGLPPGWPDIDQLDVLLARYGSPVRDTLIPSDAEPPRPDDLDRATLSLALKAFRVAPGPPPGPAIPVVPKVLKVVSATVVSANACVEVTPAPTGGSVTVAVPGGGWLEVSGPAADLTALLGHLRPPTARFQLTIPTRAGDGATLAVPDLGDGSSWQVALDFPAGTGRAEVCVFSG